MIYGYIRASEDNKQWKSTPQNQFGERQETVINKWSGATISAEKNIETCKPGRLLKKMRKVMCLFARSFRVLEEIY